MTPGHWPGFRSVLCAVDFSDQSALALRYADAVARRGRARLTVLHVNDPLLVAAAAAALRDRRLVRRSARELQDFVDATLPSDARKRLHLKTHVSIGQPSDEILRTAVARRADLVVLGTHGLTGPNRLLIGSSTLSVLQRTPVPVLAVPPKNHHVSSSLPPSTWPGERILAAIELDGRPARDIGAAARIAQWFGASLLLVHVVGEVTAPAWVKGDLSAHDRVRMDSARQQLEAMAAGPRRQTTIDVRVVCGHIPDEIAALAAVERAGLVVTALHDRRGWFGARRGSISYHVLTNAIAPVLAYPPQWQPR